MTTNKQNVRRAREKAEAAAYDRGYTAAGDDLAAALKRWASNPDASLEMLRKMLNETAP